LKLKGLPDSPASHQVGLASRSEDWSGVLYAIARCFSHSSRVLTKTQAGAHEGLEDTVVGARFGEQLACEGQVRSHPRSDGTQRVRFRFRAGGKEERAEQPARSSIRRVLSPKSWSLVPWKHATCISTRSNPRFQACPFPSVGVLCPSPVPWAASSSEVESDMSIMRQSGHWFHCARRTHLPNQDGQRLAGSTPAFFTEAVTVSVRLTRQEPQPFCSPTLCCNNNALELDHTLRCKFATGSL
jgi:hypothetical protein